MSENVIEFRSRRNYQQVLEETEREGEEARKAAIEAHLFVIDRVREMIVDGRLEGLVIAAREPVSGLFFTDLVFPGGGVEPRVANEYVGILELLKLEMAEVSTMMPVLTTDGIVDPNNSDMIEDD